MATDLDALAIGDFVLLKHEQPMGLRADADAYVQQFAPD